MLKCDYELVEKDLIESIGWKNVTPVYITKLNRYSDARLYSSIGEFEVLRTELLSKLMEYTNKGRNFKPVSNWLLKTHEEVLFILDEIRNELLSRKPKW